MDVILICALTYILVDIIVTNIVKRRKKKEKEEGKRIPNNLKSEIMKGNFDGKDFEGKFMVVCDELAEKRSSKGTEEICGKCGKEVWLPKMTLKGVSESVDKPNLKPSDVDIRCKECGALDFVDHMSKGKNVGIAMPADSKMKEMIDDLMKKEKGIKIDLDNDDNDEKDDYDKGEDLTTNFKKKFGNDPHRDRLDRLFGKDED